MLTPVDTWMAARSAAACAFCDTDFYGVDGPGGGVYPSAVELTAAVKAAWTAVDAAPLVVCTGGEPLLQMDAALVEHLHRAGFEIALETNGTLAPPPGVDWICCSPKANAELALLAGDELKLVFPQEGIDPAVALAEQE